MVPVDVLVGDPFLIEAALDLDTLDLKQNHHIPFQALLPSA